MIPGHLRFEKLCLHTGRVHVQEEFRIKNVYLKSCLKTTQTIIFLVEHISYL